jgi:hypothetical protein
VHVTASGENIRVTDRHRGGHEELSVEELHDSTELVVGDNLLQAEFKLEETFNTFFLHLETSIAKRLDPKAFFGPSSYRTWHRNQRRC